MFSDIEIAQKNEMAPIADVAKKIGIDENCLDFYGKYKAKIFCKKNFLLLALQNLQLATETFFFALAAQKAFLSANFLKK